MNENISTNIKDFLEITGVKTVNNGKKTIVLYIEALKTKNLFINEKILTNMKRKSNLLYIITFINSTFFKLYNFCKNILLFINSMHLYKNL